MIRVLLNIEMAGEEADFAYRPSIAHLGDLRGQVRGLLADAQRDAEAWLASRDKPKTDGAA